MIARRTVLAVIGGVLALTPGVLPADAQQPAKFHRIGYLSGFTEAVHASSHQVFIEALARHGWVDGRNLVIEYRSANGSLDALPKLATELAAARVDLLMAAGGSPEALAAKQATTTIPIVFTTGGDPVQFGIVSNLARPDGNVTGIGGGLTAVQKRLELLREITPTITRYAVLANTTNPVHPPLVRAMEAAAARRSASPSRRHCCCVPIR